jgi:hypothetical protein
LENWIGVKEESFLSQLVYIVLPFLAYQCARKFEYIKLNVLGAKIFFFIIEVAQYKSFLTILKLQLSDIQPISCTKIITF